MKLGYSGLGEMGFKTVSQNGEGKRAVEAAKDFGIPVTVIETALNFRIESHDKPSYTGQILSAMRNQFGGHNVRKGGLL